MAATEARETASSEGAEGAVRAGTLAELRKAGQLLTKVGSLPVVVFLDGDELFAIEDRCPHMGFPLHRGTVECGMVTCHWHHAGSISRAAARSIPSPTTPRASTSRSSATTCWCARASGDRLRSSTCAAASCRDWRTASRS